MDKDRIQLEIDEIFREIDAAVALAKLRKKHTYVEDMIRLLWPRKYGMRRGDVLYELEEQRRRDGLPIPDSFEATVQSAYNQNCVDSKVFLKRDLPESDAPFYSPGGKNSGKWAVNQERGRQWLKRRKRDLE